MRRRPRRRRRKRYPPASHPHCNRTYVLVYDICSLHHLHSLFGDDKYRCVSHLALVSGCSAVLSKLKLSAKAYTSWIASLRIVS